MPEKFFGDGITLKFEVTPSGLVSLRPRSEHTAISLLDIISGMYLECDYCKKTGVMTVWAGDVRIVGDLLHTLRQNEVLFSDLSLSARDREPLKAILGNKTI